MEIILRDAVQDDVQQLAQIHVNSWKSTFSGLMPDKYINGYTLSSRVNEWQSVIHSRSEIVVVAERGGIVIGFMSYRVNPENLATIELCKLYLCPSAYGQRFGSKLLNHLKLSAQAQGMKAISLYVLDSNKVAINFYSKHGFEFSGGFVSVEFEGAAIIDLLMTIRLK
ncbi:MULTISPECIES: GNAT family N-acetyltransferase [unclassified Shewanella]|uniref:GNAT family N-acetyltransferase n=1 Tax=unclassified Shewanella TaxID=196818 RepID=UPI001BC7FC37|nr:MULTISPECIES: GNAT family N-acetyltransferase [unclassified Shewanella]GIU16992.1 hypothetical protein TUM4444_30320 [Shewanella sp. MBTL60-112-B1]GIU38733.1 hypothetical protein TUM4445_33340 [Shewanella sp. MBTL60-112-B2]